MNPALAELSKIVASAYSPQIIRCFFFHLIENGIVLVEGDQLG